MHAHTQVLGKLAATLAPPEPQLQHSALRLSGRGWETLPLPAPDGSGGLVVALDLHSHEAVAEHTDGRTHRVSLAPDRPVAEVTGEPLAAVSDLVGPVRIDPTPQETPWTVPLDEDYRTYDPAQVSAYFAAATRAALVLGALRAPYRGRSTPVNAWWGTFDLAVSLFSGRPVDPPSSDFIMRTRRTPSRSRWAGGPGTPATRTPPSSPSPSRPPTATTRPTLSPSAARWHPDLREFILNWDDVRAAPNPDRVAPDFGRSAVENACSVCGWDPDLAASAQRVLPPIV